MPDLHKPRQALATVLIGLSVICVGLSLRAKSQASASFGPQALGIVGEQVWIADEHGVMVADATGKLLLQRSFDELTLGSVGSIVAMTRSAYCWQAVGAPP